MRALIQRSLMSAFRCLLVGWCALALCASQAFAQSQSNAADLQGFVRDQQEAVVTNATVTATNKATGVS
ncbi:MAG: carboxypeptidase-like regulatory domain-containing protein, partial [Pyrinomonadaceae bacterium]